MEEKIFGDLNIGDEVYVFNVNDSDNDTIEELTIKSFGSNVPPLFRIIRFNGINSHEIILNKAYEIVEVNGILYATSKKLIFEWLKNRCDTIKSNIVYYQEKIKLLEEEISECKENAKYYNGEKGKLLSFIGRLRNRYYL